ncbi:MAG: hypothetical protein AAF417_17120, partial [Pseudomonadota bacterium]
VPLECITSVPLLGNHVLKALKKRSGKSLLVSLHHGSKLRLVFMSEGHILSARLSHSSGLSADGFPQSVLSEIQRSRRYLERARHMRADERVDVYLMMDAEQAERVAAAVSEAETALQAHVVSLADVARAMRLSQPPPGDRVEVLYIEAAAKFRAVYNYASSDVTRWHRLYSYRSAAATALVVVSLAAAWLTGENLVQSMELQRSYATMLQQTRQMEETFRREHQEFGESQAESQEMKSAVDAGDFILANRVPVDIVMSQLATVFNTFPTVRIDELEWAIDGAPVTTSLRSEDEPQPFLPTTSLTAQIVGQIVPFDGDFRQAFATIERLRKVLDERPALTDVAAIEYPINARPDATISGELVGAGTQRSAPFRLTLRIVPIGGAADDDSA